MEGLAEIVVRAAPILVADTGHVLRGGVALVSRLIEK